MDVENKQHSGSTSVALLRITLGVIVLVTWVDNLRKDLYTADGLEGFLDYLFDAEGNNSGFGLYKDVLDAVVIPLAGPVGVLQAVVELAIGLGLLFGIGTRLASLLASLFFVNVFLAYVGGEEWIWTYVLLVMSAVTVFLGYGGRKFGVDEHLVRTKGESPRNLVW